MTNELKPCPFCGGKAVLHPFFGGRYMATCKKCCTTMPIHDTYEEAIEAWNTRAEHTCQWIPAKRGSGVVCSNCGIGADEGIKHNGLVRYCAFCGCKVVE